MYYNIKSCDVESQASSMALWISFLRIHFLHWCLKVETGSGEVSVTFSVAFELRGSEFLPKVSLCCGAKMTLCGENPSTWLLPLLWVGLVLWPCKWCLGKEGGHWKLTLGMSWTERTTSLYKVWLQRQSWLHAGVSRFLWGSGAFVFNRI